MTIDGIRALTIQQPWASLVMLAGAGRKDVENRTWRTAYRGPLIVHAGTGIDREGLAAAARAGINTDPRRIPRGACLGVVNLDGITADHPSAWAEPDHYHWSLSDPRPLPAPVPCPGRLSLWRPPEIAARLAALVVTR